ncbi:unnamed protein product [Urochloa decumbens]|uniref:Uncharacterized protein n=1 Tax=Urochloa decumbens TaxID=240449 RepID=A0ABC9CYE9_9POAL
MEADAGKPRFGCLRAARCVVAVVVTVLIVAITLNTVKLILYLRSRQHATVVDLSVIRGLVYVRRVAATATHPPSLQFYLGVQVSGAADGLRYYASNMTACLFGENTPSLAERDAICCFHQGPVFTKAVEQQTRHYFLMEANTTRGGTTNSSTSNFDRLYRKGGSLDGVTLFLEGTFVAERRSRRYTASQDINFCESLIISDLETDEDELLDHRYDQPCAKGAKG